MRYRQHLAAHLRSLVALSAIVQAIIGCDAGVTLSGTAFFDPSVQSEAESASPVLSVSVTDIDVGLDGTQASFFVSNIGGGTLCYTVTSEVAWATPTPSEGESAGEDDEIVVSVSRAGLSAGEYRQEILVEADDGQSETVIVQMTVPSVQLSTDLLDFGLDGVQQSVVLHATPGVPAALACTITPSAPWIRVDPATNLTVGPEVQELWVTIDRCDSTWQTGLNEAELIVDVENGEQHVLTVLAERAAPPSEEEVLAWLRDLPPLPKVHHSAQLGSDLLDDPNSPLLHEWVRITHAVSFDPRGSWRLARVENIVAACQQVNALEPSIPATIALYYQPFRDLPVGAPPSYAGPELQQALDDCEVYFTQMKNQLAIANANLAADIQVSSILLECEHWYVRDEDMPGGQEHNAAMTAKYDAAYDICRSVLPNPPIDWYRRGESGALRRVHFVLDEQGESYVPSFYFPIDFGRAREIFVDAYDQAQADGVDRMVGWITLGGSQVELPSGLWRYVCDLPYDTSYSWQIGAELNIPGYPQPPDGTTAPWEVVDAFGIYPAATDTRFSSFARHFVAYVRGANGLPLEE